MLACRSRMLRVLLLLAIESFEHGFLLDELLVAGDNESCNAEHRGEKTANFREEVHEVL